MISEKFINHLKSELQNIKDEGLYKNERIIFIMKKTKFLLVLIFLGLIISCGKKDSNKENLQKSIISSKEKNSKKEIQETVLYL